MDLTIIEAGIAAIGAVGGGGIAYGAARARLTHTESRIAAVSADLDKHDLRTSGFGDKLSVVSERLARIETTLMQIEKRLA